ncbi:MAG TPA: NUDIX hydrolase [Magnetospirillaceae bacterium]|nr:NUDIX hydrolase [Magnetospirillaceae bacterium]
MRTFHPAGTHYIPKHAKRVFKGVIYDVYHWRQKRFDGSEVTFEMLKRPDTVKVIAIKDDHIVAIMEEQPDRPSTLTLPGGRHDVESEDELDCAKRELHEETGMVFKTWKLIAATQPHHKIDQIVYIFLATDFERQDKPHVDPGEKIELCELTFAEAKHYGELPTNGYWPSDILRQVKSLDELIALRNMWV